jgi:hypothetical protein
MITAMKYELDRMQAYVTLFHCLVSPGKGGASGFMLSHLAVLLDYWLSLSSFGINLVNAVLITRIFRSLNAIVTQSKNFPCAVNNTIGLKIIKITRDNNDI